MLRQNLPAYCPCNFQCLTLHIPTLHRCYIYLAQWRQALDRAFQTLAWYQWSADKQKRPVPSYQHYALLLPYRREVDGLLDVFSAFHRTTPLLPHNQEGANSTRPASRTDRYCPLHIFFHTTTIFTFRSGQLFLSMPRGRWNSLLLLLRSQLQSLLWVSRWKLWFCG